MFRIMHCVWQEMDFNQMYVNKMYGGYGNPQRSYWFVTGGWNVLQLLQVTHGHCCISFLGFQQLHWQIFSRDKPRLDFQLHKKTCRKSEKSGNVPSWLSVQRTFPFCDVGSVWSCLFLFNVTVCIPDAYTHRGASWIEVADHVSWHLWMKLHVLLFDKDPGRNVYDKILEILQDHIHHPDCWSLFLHI